MRLFKIVPVAAFVVVTLMTAPADASLPNGIVDPSADAGYLITPSTLRSVSATWTVPTVSCTAPKAAVGTGILLGSRGTGHFVTLGVDVECAAGRPSYGAWLHVSGSHRARIPNKVGPGDVIDAAMRSNADDWSATLGNETRGWFGFISGPEPYAADQAGILVFRTQSRARSGYHPLANFDTVTFTHSHIDGRAVTGTLRRLEMRQAHAPAKVKTSILRRPAGAFTVTFLGAR